jgi:hypothetical protein
MRKVKGQFWRTAKLPACRPSAAAYHACVASQCGQLTVVETEATNM